MDPFIQSIEGTPPNTQKKQPPLLVDALPYIDNEYEEEPGMKEMVTHLIQEETKRFRPTAKNYVPNVEELEREVEKWETPLITTTFATLSSSSSTNQNTSSTPLSMRRYELPPPPPGKLTDLTAWLECVDNSHAQLQHQWVRLRNLELMLEYGVEAWRGWCGGVEGVVLGGNRPSDREVGGGGGGLVGELGRIKKEIQQTNWSRKSSQLEIGGKLKALEAAWVALVSKNYEIEGVLGGLEKIDRKGEEMMEED